MPSGGANLAFSKYFPWVCDFIADQLPTEPPVCQLFTSPKLLLSPLSLLKMFLLWAPSKQSPETAVVAWLSHPLFPPTLVSAPALCLFLATLVHWVHSFVHLSLQKAVPHLLGCCSGSNLAISSGSNLRKPGRQLGLPRKKNKMCLRENRCTTALGLVSSNNTFDEAAKYFG